MAILIDADNMQRNFSVHNCILHHILAVVINSISNFTANKRSTPICISINSPFQRHSTVTVIR